MSGRGRRLKTRLPVGRLPRYSVTLYPYPDKTVRVTHDGCTLKSIVTFFVDSWGITDRELHAIVQLPAGAQFRCSVMTVRRTR